MASIRKRGDAWRVEVYRAGVRESATFDTKQQAAQWALEREAELTGKRLPDRTLSDALERYAQEVAPTHIGAKWEQTRVDMLKRDRIATVKLASLVPADIAEWRDRRLKTVSAASVRREWVILASTLKLARLEWGWIRHDPATGVKKPPPPPSRKRRVSDDEVSRVSMALGYDGGKPQNASHRVALAWEFALETAMRSGEIVGLKWPDILPKKAILPRTKNGDVREVPLSKRAREILDLLPRDSETVFGVSGALRDALFRRAVKRSGIHDLHFHDSRAEAIWRLSKKLPVLDLARVIGHRDLRSLMIYYNADASTLADLLD